MRTEYWKVEGIVAGEAVTVPIRRSTSGRFNIAAVSPFAEDFDSADSVTTAFQAELAPDAHLGTPVRTTAREIMNVSEDFRGFMKRRERQRG